jgi:hypothetical protein
MLILNTKKIENLTKSQNEKKNHLKKVMRKNEITKKDILSNTTQKKVVQCTVK